MSSTLLPHSEGQADAPAELSASIVDESDFEYLRTSCDPLLSALMCELAVEKPEDPIAHSLQWLCEQTRWDVGACAAPRGLIAELVRLRGLVAEFASRRATLAHDIVKTDHGVNYDTEGEGVGAHPNISADEASDMLLRAAPVLRVLTAAELRGVAARLRLEQFRAGDVVVRERRHCSRLYILLRGDCQAESKNQPDGPVSYHAGASFGQLALYGGKGTRNEATVVASSGTVELLSLSPLALRRAVGPIEGVLDRAAAAAAAAVAAPLPRVSNHIAKENSSS